MTTPANRQMRGARNRLVDLLGIGDALPMRDLPVSAAPAIVPFGGAATVTIEDAEPGVAYRLRKQAGAALPSGVTVEGVGDGGTLELLMPKINEPITFTVEAARESGRTALLLNSAPVAIGLDNSIPAVVEGFEATPVLVDFGTSITVLLSHSQEAVAYRLVTRPPRDTAEDTDLAALDTDILMTDGADVRGTGGPITLRSLPLAEDGILRVRLVKTFPGRRETQVSLLTATLPTYVRADRDRPVSVAPLIVDYGQATTLTVSAAQAGVSYALHLAPIADASFDRADPPDPDLLTVATDDGPVRVRPPSLPSLFDALPGFTPSGKSKKATGADLERPLPPLTSDTHVVVAATKQHGSGDTSFVSAVPLAATAIALVRPSPSPILRIEARIADGTLTQLRAFGGEPGVFYAISAEGKRLGEFYMHQRDAADANRNKGVDLLAVGVDFVIAVDATNAAPPPVPCIDLTARPLPAELEIAARRAMTRLVQPLAARIGIAAPPEITVELSGSAPNPPAGISRATVRSETSVRADVPPPEPDGTLARTATVTLASAAATARYVLLVDGVALGDPVPGTDGSLVLETGPLPDGAVVEVLILDPPNAGISVERRVAVPPPGS